MLSVRAKDVYVQSVASLLQVLDEKDPCTARHPVNVSFYAEQIAEQMGCSRSTVKAVRNAALMHDIGKVGVPDKILMKRTPLTELERMVMEQVPLIGTRIVNHLRILESEVQIIRHQRERYDGSLAELQTCSGTQFDPQAVTALRQLLDADHEAWQRRIQDTVQAMSIPADTRLAPATELCQIDPH